MSRLWVYSLVVAVLLIVVGVSAEVSTRSETCMACHTQEQAYVEWMTEKLKDRKKGFSHELISCAACHMEGAAEGTIMSRFRGLLHTVQYFVPQMDPRRPLVTRMFKEVRIPSENCQYCHLGSIVRKTVMLRDLPPRLQRIGLQMDHRKHVLASEETCAKCHERYKDKQPEEVDRTVNYAEVNHLSCDACHASASHTYRTGRLLPLSQAEFHQAREEAWTTLSNNPRWMIALPTEQTCRRCHNGKIHFKTRIFLADCSQGKNYENCVKCHPLMTKEFFEQHRQDKTMLTRMSGNPTSSTEQEN